MTQRGWKTLAIVCLMLAIAAIADSLRASWRAGEILGPNALVATPRHELWIGVDDELWRASADGRLLAALPLAELGLPGPAANLVRHPDDSVVATVRDDPLLYVLDPSSAHVRRTLRLQWPADLERHAGRAINLAFDDRGRVAVATGGGHAVALFDAEGRFIARTAPDTYRFTNGLWWSGDTLWTTDTNRTALRQLAGDTLAVQRSVEIARQGAPAFLGLARARPAGGSAVDVQAALVRFRNGMIRGSVSLVAAEGHDTPLPSADDLEPRDLEWLDDQLVVGEGQSFTLLRWSARGEPLAPFGDEALQQRLHGRLDERHALERRHTLMLRAGIAIFVLAAALVLWSERMKQRERPPLDLTHLLVTPLPMAALLRRAATLSWPWLLWIALTLPLRWPGAMAWVRARGGLPLVTGVFALMLLGALVAGGFTWRRWRRAVREPAFEPLLNALALRKLERSAPLAEALREGERVRETFMWRRGLPARWVVLTNERLLVFQSTLFDERLQRSIALADVVGASNERGALQVTGAAPRPRWGLSAWVEIALRDGEVLGGHVGSQALARRLVQRLPRAARAVSAAPGARSARPPRATSAARRRPRWATALASALVPGAGQWAQRRGRIALTLFVPWLALLLFITVPIVWSLAGPRKEVSMQIVALVAAMHLFVAALAAWDAYRTPS